MTGVNQVSRNLIFNILILIKSKLNKKNKLFDQHTTNTVSDSIKVFHEILDDIESKCSNTSCLHNIAAKIV